MIPATRINHAVLYVRDASVATAFYTKAFDFEVIEEVPGRAAFLRARQGTNHHDLGLFSVGPDAPLPQAGHVGLYHLAWEVPTIDALIDARASLLEMGALVGENDHGASLSLYAKDPDGNEFEVMWLVPEDDWDRKPEFISHRGLDLGAAQQHFATR